MSDITLTPAEAVYHRLDRDIAEGIRLGLLPGITVAYIRSAVAEQGGSLSLRRQRRICADYAESLGECVSTIYADAGVSGRATHRPGLDQLRRDLARGHICRVITLAPHVLARNQALEQHLRRTIRDAGASLAMPCDHQAIASQERRYL